LQEHLGEFEARIVRVVAVSVDRPEDIRNLCRKQGYAYTFLSDAKREVIRRYDLVHVNGGPSGDIARPAEFLIDPGGVIRWVNLSEDYRVRARPKQMLQVIDSLRSASTPGS